MDKLSRDEIANLACPCPSHCLSLRLLLQPLCWQQQLLLCACSLAAFVHSLSTHPTVSVSRKGDWEENGPTGGAGAQPGGAERV